MINHRLIARLDIKGPNLIKGVHLEGLRVIGDPQQYAHKYYVEGIDELIYIDSVASLYERNNLTDIVKYTAENIFIPMTVGGGIRSVSDVEKLLRSGADKVAINTAAIKSPQLISEVSNHFGSQCVVINIEAKRTDHDKWECYIDNGREKTGIDVIEWAKKVQDLGAGEILLTSVDQEGTKKGFDIPLSKQVSDVVNIPVIASGGMGKPEDLVDVIKNGHVDAVAMADILHYNRFSLDELRQFAKENAVQVRHI
jgi:cyclase